MATMEKLRQHLGKSQKEVGEAVSKAGDAKYNLDVRSKKKKSKRLARKISKIVYKEKKAKEKKRKKKGDDAKAE